MMFKCTAARTQRRQGQRLQQYNKHVLRSILGYNSEPSHFNPFNWHWYSASLPYHRVRVYRAPAPYISQYYAKKDNSDIAFKLLILPTLTHILNAHKQYLILSIIMVGTTSDVFRQMVLQGQAAAAEPTGVRHWTRSQGRRPRVIAPVPAPAPAPLATIGLATTSLTLPPTVFAAAPTPVSRPVIAVTGPEPVADTWPASADPLPEKAFIHHAASDNQPRIYAGHQTMIYATEPQAVVKDNQPRIYAGHQPMTSIYATDSQAISAQVADLQATESDISPTIYATDSQATVSDTQPRMYNGTRSRTTPDIHTRIYSVDPKATESSAHLRIYAGTRQPTATSPQLPPQATLPPTAQPQDHLSTLPVELQQAIIGQTVLLSTDTNRLDLDELPNLPIFSANQALRDMALEQFGAVNKFEARVISNYRDSNYLNKRVRKRDLDSTSFRFPTAPAAHRRLDIVPGTPAFPAPFVNTRPTWTTGDLAFSSGKLRRARKTAALGQQRSLIDGLIEQNQVRFNDIDLVVLAPKSWATWDVKHPALRQEAHTSVLQIRVAKGGELVFPSLPPPVQVIATPVFPINYHPQHIAIDHPERRLGYKMHVEARKVARRIRRDHVAQTGGAFRGFTFRELELIAGKFVHWP